MCCNSEVPTDTKLHRCLYGTGSSYIIILSFSFSICLNKPNKREKKTRLNEFFKKLEKML